MSDERLEREERQELRRKARAATLAALQALGGVGRREAIHDWALDHGGFSPRELTAPGPHPDKHPRLVDHELSWALTNLKRDGLVENPSRSVWRLPDAPVAAVDPKRLAELRALPYPLYLRTPEWKRTRLAALRRAGRCCSLDVSHTDGLEVHHRTYERLGAELESDVIVLCHACHQLHHRMYGPLPLELPVSPPAAEQAEPVAKRSWLRRLLTG